MYCRVCGNRINDNAEICVKCGCRPLNGNEYCQNCGSTTSEKQEMCTSCGIMLKTKSNNFKNIFEGIDLANSNTHEMDLDFSELDPFYQKEFSRIYESGETYKGKFNVWAFLFGFIWALTKGCWLSAVVAFVVSMITGGIGGVVYWFIYGFRGTYMYYCSYVKNKQCII